MEVNNQALYFKNNMKITRGPWATLLRCIKLLWFRWAKNKGLEFQTKSLPAEIILTLLAKESKECFFGF